MTCFRQRRPRSIEIQRGANETRDRTSVMAKAIAIADNPIWIALGKDVDLLLWKNVNGYSGLELNKVSHEANSAPALYLFPKRSLRKKFINPIENETPSISLRCQFEKLDSWDFRRSAESWCQSQYSEKISGSLKLKRPIRTLRVVSMNSVTGSTAVQWYANLLNALNNRGVNDQETPQYWMEYLGRIWFCDKDPIFIVVFSRFIIMFLRRLSIFWIPYDI
jgi:hypothetical protein